MLSLVGALEWGVGVYLCISSKTSIKTSITSYGSFVFSMKLMKSVVSLTFDLCCCAIG